MNFTYLITGGFLKGYRTYLLMGLAVAGVVIAWADGDMSTAQAFPALVGALGLGAAANH